MFVLDTTIKLHHTDAAGLLFFAHQFTLAHDCFEAWLESVNLGFAKIIRESDYLLPIVHAEADFQTPLYVGERITIQMSLASLGNTSMAFAYALLRAHQPCGSVKLIHVCMDKRTGQKREIPADLRKLLGAF